MSFNTNNNINASIASDIALFCKYPGCHKTRVYKVTGDLHNFCKYHREKASENQRRYAQNKRERKRQKLMSQASDMENATKTNDEFIIPFSPSSIFPLDDAGVMPEASALSLLEGLEDSLFASDQESLFSPDPYIQEEINWLTECLLTSSGE